jgi:hypothetical protein
MCERDPFVIPTTVFVYIISFPLVSPFCFRFTWLKVFKLNWSLHNIVERSVSQFIFHKKVDRMCVGGD